MTYALDNRFTDVQANPLFRATTIFGSKYWSDSEFGDYGMNRLNLLLKHFTVPIRNAMPTIDNQLRRNDFKKLLAYIKNQNRFTRRHPLSVFEDIYADDRKGETTDTYFLLCIPQCCILSLNIRM